MSLDFQQVQEQVRQIGEGAQAHEQKRMELLEQAWQWLERWNEESGWLLRQIVEAVSHEPMVRCARPTDAAVRKPEPLRVAFPPGQLPERATVLAADGSQISPDRHAEVLYCLINVGAIQMQYGSPEPPRTTIISRLLYAEELFTPAGLISEALLSILRDQHERAILADLAEEAVHPVITFTDGPIELWGAKGSDEETASFRENLQKYLDALERLCRMDVIVGGYVDKPMSDLVVRMLEIASASGKELADLRRYRPLRGVADRDLFESLLKPGERSAVFALQSTSDRQYQGELALHFFYINVGSEVHPWVARVEIPAWVARDDRKLEHLHATLIDQCQMMGGRHFPYLLHRAHETAVVTLPEKEQVTQMIALELRRRGVSVGRPSEKLQAKRAS